MNIKGYNAPEPRIGKIITVFYDEIPKIYKDKHFSVIDITQLGVPMKYIMTAEMVRLVHYEKDGRCSCRVLKDRFTY